jgi:hypothetical protein
MTMPMMEMTVVPQYVTRETPQPGDRIRNSEGGMGTVVDVQTGARSIAYGEIAIKWDEGVVVIHHSRAKDFALVSRESR